MRVPDGTGLLVLDRFTQELQDLLRVPVDDVPDDIVKARVHTSVEWDLLPQRPRPAARCPGGRRGQR